MDRLVRDRTPALVANDRSAPGRVSCPVAAVVCLLTLSTVDCSDKRPVLYPDPYYQGVGRARAEQHIAICLQLARSAG